MDHLCPRLSFPLAPCLQCLSGSPAIAYPKERSNSVQYFEFPSPPSSSKPWSKTTSQPKQTSKPSRRPKLSLQTRMPSLQSIPQHQVMEELSASVAAFVIQQNEANNRSTNPISVRAMRKDSATAPWLEPIEQVRTNT